MRRGKEKVGGRAGEPRVGKKQRGRGTGKGGGERRKGKQEGENASTWQRGLNDSVPTYCTWLYLSQVIPLCLEEITPRAAPTGQHFFGF